MEPATLSLRPSRTPRRATALCVSLAAAVVALLLPVAANAAATPALSADSFVDSIGVNTHTYYDDTVYYSRFGAVKEKLAELGVRHIRENLVPDRPDQYERLRELAQLGASATLIMGDPGEADGLDELLSIVRTELGGAVAALEGPNEFDMWGGADWMSGLRPYQQRLYAEVKSDPALASLPVVGPSIVHRRNQEALGDVSGDLDYGNIHSYPDGYGPEENLDRHLAAASLNSGSEPVMATETGYHTAAGWGGEHNPVSEAAMATYVPRMYLEYFRRGIVRTFSYELLDEEGGSGEREDNFGLLRNDFSEKPAFVALRNTIDILEDPGAGFAPGSLAYAVGGESEDVHHVLLQKRDGSFYLALWRVEDVIDPESQAPQAVPAAPVTIAFGRQVTSAASYLPNASSAPVGTLPAGGNEVTLNVGADVAIVRLTFGGKAAATGRIKAWVSRRTVPAGGRVAVKGRLPKQLAGHTRWVKIQQWRGKGWRTIGHTRTRKSGVFRKKIRLPVRRAGRARVRVVANVAKPSRPLRVRIRRR